MTGERLWTPDAERIAAAEVTRFITILNETRGLNLADSRDLYQWSITDSPAFWDAIWDFGGVIGDKGSRRIENGDQMPGAHFFPDARLNFAENLLKSAGPGDALVFRGEDKASERWSHDDLRAMVSRLQQAMLDAGVGAGDRVAGYLPNFPIAVAAMLAAASIGAVWSSASPDFGPRGVLDRFGQIEPKLFITVDGYWYAGKRLPLTDKLAEILSGLPSVTRVVVADYLGDAEATAAALPNAISLSAFIAPFSVKPLDFVPLPFDHPLYILFSSGTTGVPKCIVHRAGGVLLQHIKEHRLHADTKAGDRVFYFTTLGWMMWNWLVGGLGAGATLLLYDGSPFHPDAGMLFDYADAESMTMFGTSAKYIDAVKKSGLIPKDVYRLNSLRGLASTGSPLSPESFDFVYQSIKSDLHLASISGGTDIVSCFVLGDPTRPVFKGEIQGPGYGMAVEVWTDEGRAAAVGEKGELVCVKPFPVMPLQFWNDPGDAKYRAAYFERFENIWCHGDFAEMTPEGGLIIHGRSDATLNPGGVRIGTAEIYAQVEQIPEVLEALAVGQDYDGDVRVILFLRLREGTVLDEALDKRIRAKIRSGASPRHVPAKILAVTDIPRTKSGKITELAVREVIHGRPVKNKEALANPEALLLFENLEALRQP